MGMIKKIKQFPCNQLYSQAIRTQNLNNIVLVVEFNWDNLLKACIQANARQALHKRVYKGSKNARETDRKTQREIERALRQTFYFTCRDQGMK